MHHRHVSSGGLAEQLYCDMEDVGEAGAITVNTSVWKPGVYVAVANVGGKTVTQKVAIK